MRISKIVAGLGVSGAIAMAPVATATAADAGTVHTPAAVHTTAHMTTRATPPGNTGNHNNPVNHGGSNDNGLWGLTGLLGLGGLAGLLKRKPPERHTSVPTQGHTGATANYSDRERQNVRSSADTVRSAADRERQNVRSR